MRVLVTGAAGFLGAYVVTELTNRGHRVTGMLHERRVSPDLEKTMETRVADLTDRASLVEATKGTDAVVHLAAYYTFFGRKELYEKVTVGGTRSLIEACLENGVRRLIYCSSTEAMGPVESPPADEGTPLKPSYEYGRSKVKAERVVRESSAQGMEWTIIRPSGLYGPGNVDDVAYWFIVSIAKNSLATKFLVGAGRNLVQFVHAKDAARAFGLALDNPKASVGQTYLVSDDHAVSYRELYSIVTELFGRKPPGVSVPKAMAKAMIAPVEAFNAITGRSSFMWHRSTVDAVTSDRSFSSAKAARELGYAPTFGLEEGLKETVEWYRAKGYL
ncbi:MAG TPA: NAD-dependent epimerase/dehydratase family protein [Conexivisphaerales archaeon]|nr:NAD-dependent epimerase/dehydratase family protein [Conexivisphaerales archaeon]